MLTQSLVSQSSWFWLAEPQGGRTASYMMAAFARTERYSTCGSTLHLPFATSDRGRPTQAHLYAAMHGLRSRLAACGATV